MQNPETRYAKSGDVNIAHQVVGDGPIDIVLVDQWFSHVEAMWDVPPLARLVERLARFARVLLFDSEEPGCRILFQSPHSPRSRNGWTMWSRSWMRLRRNEPLSLRAWRAASWR